ncbi:MAG: NAD(P)/FAD-dependent oxidoreductase [Bacilli bacterium]|nr:NAD(P)/FAD-dependent oxidoreductase [Bacilli bacterium]
MERLDALVIGAGVAGITAGIYMKRSNLSCVVLDKDAPGGKLNNIHRIDNYPGVPTVDGPQLAMALFTQATDLGVVIDYGEVTSVKLAADGSFLIKTDVNEYNAIALIVAAGVVTGAVACPGERALRGKGVSYCATCDGNFFKGKDVLVYGYKDHAVEDAIYLSSLARKVTFLHDAPLETPESHLEVLKGKENVEIKEGKLLSVLGETKVTGASIETSEGKTEVEVDAVFPLSGEVSSSQFLQGLGVNMVNGFIEVNSDMETNVPGLYAAGDVLKKKLRQIVNAAGEGAVSASSAITYIHSKKRKAA